MPCNSDGYCPEPHIVLDALLCSACRSLSDLGFDFAKNPELDIWWAKHVAEDNKRLAAEARERQELLEATTLAGTKLVANMTKAEKALLRKYKII